MRILIDARRIEVYPTGVGRYVRELATALASTKHSIGLASQAGSAGARLAAELNAQFVTIGHELQPWPHQTRWFDIVHLTYPLVRPPSNCHYVVSIHDLLYMHRRWAPLPKRLLYERLIRRVLNQALTVIAGSEFTRTEVERFFPEYSGQIRVVEYAPSLTEMPEGNEPELPEGTLVYVGNLRPHKGVTTVIEALADFSDYNLAICTADDPKVVKHEIHRNGVASRTAAYRDRTDAFIASAMKKSLAVVCPSFYEGSGLPLRDALALGVPVIASRIPAFDEVLGHNGWRFDPGNAEGLGRAVRDLTRTPLDDRASGVKARTWEEVARETAEVYELA